MNRRAFFLMMAPLSGCVTATEHDLPIEQTRAFVIIRELVYLGASAYLISKPEHRPEMQRASDGLKSLVEKKKWDVTSAALALVSAGVISAQSPDALLILSSVGSVQTLLDQISGKNIDLRTVRNAEAWVSGANDGLAAALGRAVAGAPRSRSLGFDSSVAAAFRAAAEDSRRQIR